MRMILIVFVSFFSLNAISKESAYRFYQEAAQKKQEQFFFNRYENIIGGMAAFLIGNIGYFSSETNSLKFAYSAVQTIGIINVGQGIYKYYMPEVDREMYQVISKKKISREKLAAGVIEIFAKEERAKRLALLYSSTFLSAQYFINAFVGSPEKELKNIYIYLGSLNGIIMLYSFFKRDKYEKFYYEQYLKSRISFSPALFRAENHSYSGFLFSYRF